MVHAITPIPEFAITLAITNCAALCIYDIGSAYTRRVLFWLNMFGLLLFLLLIDWHDIYTWLHDIMAMATEDRIKVQVALIGVAVVSTIVLSFREAKKADDHRWNRVCFVAFCIMGGASLLTISYYWYDKSRQFLDTGSTSDGGAYLQDLSLSFGSVFFAMGFSLITLLVGVVFARSWASRPD